MEKKKRRGKKTNEFWIDGDNFRILVWISRINPFLTKVMYPSVIMVRT